MKKYEVEALWFDMDNDASTPYATEVYEVEAENSEEAWKCAFEKALKSKNCYDDVNYAIDFNEAIEL